MNPNVAANVLRYLISILVLIVLWTAVSWLFSVPEYLLPQPGTVATSLWTERSLFLPAASFTFRNAVSGAIIGIGLGVATGMIVAYSKVLHWLVEPYLVIFQSFPRESLFPLFIVWLGFGSATKILNAALLSFFPTALMTLNGLLDVRGDYVALVRGWGASKRQEFTHCRLPAFVPTLISAIKVALPLSLIGAVLGEFMGSNQGLGYLIMSSAWGFRNDRVFGAIVILGFFGIAMLVFVQVVQHRLLARFNQE